MAGYNLYDLQMKAQGEKVKRSTKRDKLVNVGRGVAEYSVLGNRIATMNLNTGRLNISDAGWKTKLTQDRLNKILPYGEGIIIQRKGDWFLRRDNKDIPFKGSMTIPVHEHLKKVNGKTIRVGTYYRRYG